MEFDPRPGRQYSDEDPHYITPDVYAHKDGEEYAVTLNDEGLPQLRVSPYYRRVLGTDGGADAKRFIKTKMRNAQWLISCIQRRQQTLLMVASSIVRFQRDFLDRGVDHLRPLVLKQVADDIEMHESTVSRATANKYIHSPQGIHLERQRCRRFRRIRRVGQESDQDDHRRRGPTAAAQRPEDRQDAEGRADRHRSPHRCQVPRDDGYSALSEAPSGCLTAPMALPESFGW